MCEGKGTRLTNQCSVCVCVCVRASQFHVACCTCCFLLPQADFLLLVLHSGFSCFGCLALLVVCLLSRDYDDIGLAVAATVVVELLCHCSQPPPLRLLLFRLDIGVAASYCFSSLFFIVLFFLTQLQGARDRTHNNFQNH